MTKLYSSTWRATVLTRIEQLDDEVKRAEAGATDPSAAQRADLEAAKGQLRIARDAVRWPGFWKMLWRWGSGSDVETAWRAIHAAEAALLMVQDVGTLKGCLPELRASLAATLGPDDARVKEYTDDLRHWEDVVDTHRAQIRAIKSAVDAASDEAHSNVRNYRNWLLIVGVVVVVGLVVLAIVHFFDSSFLFVCQGKRSGGECPDSAGASIAEIEAAGGIAGLITALFALIRLKVYSGPYALPLWQALIRLPAGAAGALLGVLVMQSGLLDTLMADSKETVIAYAVLFGVSPEIVLRTLDQKVNDIGAAASSKDDPQKPVPPAS